MNEAEYKKAEAFLILKYGSIEAAIDVWLEADGHKMDGYEMMEVFLAQPKKERN